MDNQIAQFARQVIETEAAAVAGLARAVDEGFVRAVRLILDCGGALVTTGVGKAGHVARKLSASFSSTGMPSHFLDPADAMHGDVGCVRKGDIVLMLSYSGESDEIVRILSVVKKLGNAVIGITASAGSSLGKHCDVVLQLGKLQEACPLGLAPSTTTTAMLALGDALVLTVMKMRDFTAADFAVFHPAGQLGRKLIKVREGMSFRKGENLAMASDKLTMAQVLHEAAKIKRRSGCVILTNDAGKISGVFTDADLRRLMVDADGSILRKPISDVMTHKPKRIGADQLASEAMAVFRQYRIDELPVVDDEDRPVGLIDVQDMVVLKMFDVDADKS